MATMATSQPSTEGFSSPLKPPFTAMVGGTHDQAPEPFKEASTYKGELALHYSEPEVLDLSSLLRFTLIRKFISDLPSMEFLLFSFKIIRETFNWALWTNVMSLFVLILRKIIADAGFIVYGSSRITLWRFSSGLLIFLLKKNLWLCLFGSLLNNCLYSCSLGPSFFHWPTSW